MNQEERIVRFDNNLGVEAYRFKGIMQKFPNHFHEHYVIGFVESGQRFLSCRNREYVIHSGDLLLFNPMDSHTCEQIDNHTLDYRCINIKPERMHCIASEIMGCDYQPRFKVSVVNDSELAESIRALHRMILEEGTDLEKEEIFYFLMKHLIEQFAEPAEQAKEEIEDIEIQKVCAWMEHHYMDRIALDELAGIAGRNKYSLLRSFTKIKGITPYRYLETIRVNQAKKLLEQGVEPIEAAMRTGFSDQSHFTNFFKEYIGLTPGQYRDIFSEDKK